MICESRGLEIEPQLTVRKTTYSTMDGVTFRWRRVTLERGWPLRRVAITSMIRRKPV
jgi:hypothetical protein